jgi:hypothetical protein
LGYNLGDFSLTHLATLVQGLLRVDNVHPFPLQVSGDRPVDDLRSMLQNSISAETFSDKYSP